MSMQEFYEEPPKVDDVIEEDDVRFSPEGCNDLDDYWNPVDFNEFDFDDDNFIFEDDEFDEFEDERDF